jgi:hypothetical protein
MYRKRMLLAVVVFSLVFSMVFGTAVFADNIESLENQATEQNVKIKKDKAIQIAKTMLDDVSRYEVGNIYLEPIWGMRRSSWNIEFYASSEPTGSVNIGIDANTGEIIHYNNWDHYREQQNFIAKITRSEALKIAQDFLKSKINFDMDSYELQKENPYNYAYRVGGVKEMVQHDFNFFKKHNGIPVQNYMISVSVDGTDGKIRHYYNSSIDIDTSRLPSVEGILDEDQAMEKYKDSVNLALQYITSYEDRYFGPSKPKVILAYVPLRYISMIDAKSGKAINYDDSEIDLSSQQYKELVENPVALDPNATLKSKAVTEAQARAIAEKYKDMAEKLFGVDFDENDGINRTFYQSMNDDNLNYNWNISKNNEHTYVNISINSQTGHVVNIGMGKNNFDYEIQMKEGGKMPKVNEKVSWKQGKEKALELVKKILPEQYGFFADQNVEKPQYSEEVEKYMKEHNYSFVRVVDGLRYRDNNINISIDRETGEMKNFYFSWLDVDFPSASKIISKDEAVKRYFEGIEPSLSYYIASIYNPSTGQEKLSENPRIIYSFSGSSSWYGDIIIDAVTGKFVDWAGREIKIESGPGETELQEHWAKRSTELLIAQGIIKNPYIKYDEHITRAEAVKMMSIAKGIHYYGNVQIGGPSFNDVSKDDDYYSYIENAVTQKILTKTGGNFNGSEAITKEEFAQLLVNLMGYTDIAAKSEIYKLTNAQNVNSDYIGSVAICYALDVLPVKDGAAFVGNEKVTNAEAAVALYKALKYIR